MKILFVIGVVTVGAVLWDFHSQALVRARQAGHSDVYRIICERHHKVGEMLLDDMFGDPGIGGPIHCSDFEEEE